MKIDIPDVHQEFCKAVAKLAREHGLDKFSGTFEPGFKDPSDWQDRIEFSWEQGRHGEDSDRLFMSSTKRVWTHLGPEKVYP
jgi:hypothetical protein